MSRRDRAVLTATGVALVAALAAIGALPAPRLRVGVFLALYAAAFAAYALAVRTVLRLRACDRATAALILSVAVLGHAAVLPARPDLSTDVYRYAWEGRVMLEGANPFAVAPADSTLAHLRDDDYEAVSHKDLATIYPPLAQGLFALAAKVHPGVRTLKVILSLFDLATVLVLFRLLRRRGRSEAHALVYAWSPLVIVETGHSGHVDAAGVFLLVLGLHLYLSGRRAWAGAVLGLSFLVKYLAAAIAPFLARRRAAALVALVAVAALGYAPFLDAGARLAGSLREYGAHWWFNGPPFLALAGIAGDPMLARRLLAAAGVAFAIAAASRERDLARYAYLVIACALLVSPTVYPWYATWLVPLLCVFPSRAWIAFTGLVALSYTVWTVYGDTGAWVLPTWVLALEYLPFYALLLAGLARRRPAGEARR
jgi:hypothetical protein